MTNAKEAPEGAFLDRIFNTAGITESGLYSDEQKSSSDIDELAMGVAMAGAQLKTGLRWKEEKQAFNQSLDDLFTVANDIANELYDELDEAGEDIHTIKQAIESFFEEDIYLKIVDTELHMRLESSVIERLRERLSRKRISRKVGTFAVLIASSSIGYQTTDALFDHHGEEVNVGGGVLAYILTRAIQSQIRTGPTKMAALLRGKAETIVEEYGSDAHDAYLIKMQKLGHISPESTVSGYAEKKTHELSGVLAKHVLDKQVGDDQQADIQDMITDCIAIVRYYLQHEVYGSAERKPGALKRIRSKIASEHQ